MAALDAGCSRGHPVELQLVRPRDLPHVHLQRDAHPPEGVLVVPKVHLRSPPCPQSLRPLRRLCDPPRQHLRVSGAGAAHHSDGKPPPRPPGHQTVKSFRAEPFGLVTQLPANGGREEGSHPPEVFAADEHDGASHTGTVRGRHARYYREPTVPCLHRHALLLGHLGGG
eukprot:63604-Prorocentrum_minimum.AAC.2